MFASSATIFIIRHLSLSSPTPSSMLLLVAGGRIGHVLDSQLYHKYTYIVYIFIINMIVNFPVAVKPMKKRKWSDQPTPYPTTTNSTATTAIVLLVLYCSYIFIAPQKLSYEASPWKYQFIFSRLYRKSNFLFNLKRKMFFLFYTFFYIYIDIPWFVFACLALKLTLVRFILFFTLYIRPYT